MHPRFSIPRFGCPKILSESTKFLSDHTNRLAEKARLAERVRPATDYLAQRPRKLVLGAATATVAVAGIGAAAATTGPGPANGAIGTPGSVSYSGAVHAANHKAAHGNLSSDQGTHHRTVSQHAPSKHAPSKHAAAPESKHATRQHTASHHRVVHHAATHHVSHGHTATATKPYLIYDSTTPSAIPAHRNAAVYATGNYAASPSDVTGRDKVLWIDTTGGDRHASVLDVEPGDATPAGAADWARNRLAADPHAVARLYTFRNEWPQVQAAVHTLPQQMQSRIRWWIADPTGVPHIVPGSAATQWYWGSSYDITTASPRF
ncbi:MAG TPA: hypothetical protein VFI65_34260 [Streptosporangiaceae bacterium]|nr:hypothetical protein [Streptosporangiaceae bacterium]